MKGDEFFLELGLQVACLCFYGFIRYHWFFGFVNRAKLTSKKKSLIFSLRCPPLHNFASQTYYATERFARYFFNRARLTSKKKSLIFSLRCPLLRDKASPCLYATERLARYFLQYFFLRIISHSTSKISMIRIFSYFLICS